MASISNNLNILLCAFPSCNLPVRILPTGKPAKHCSNTCKNMHNSQKGTEKRKQTCLDRFGATTNLKTADTQEKIKKTVLEKYGVEHPAQNKHVLDKVLATKLSKYGDQAFNNRIKFKENWNTKTSEDISQIVDTRKKTNLEKFGKESYFQTDEFQEKTKKVWNRKYGVDNPSQRHMSQETIDKINDPLWLKENTNTSIHTLKSELNVSSFCIRSAYKKYSITRPEFLYSSYGEIELGDFIKSLGFAIEQNISIAGSKKELDIYIPSKNLAIEYNGLYWHTENSGHKDKNYHLDKTEKCLKQDIRLVHIFDYEWINKQEIVKSRLRNMLGKSERIYARNCSIRQVPSKDAKLFFDQTHIQGHVPAKLTYGLYYENNLMAAMSFGKPRYNKKFDWELIRYACALNTTVVGGASKLFKHFVKEHEVKNMITYSDRRWNTGNLYTQLGFSFVKNSGPNYFYTNDYETVYSRVQFQKHKLVKKLEVFDPNLTEWENMQLNGFDRIWDCGNSCYQFDKNQPSIAL